MSKSSAAEAMITADGKIIYPILPAASPSQGAAETFQSKVHLENKDLATGEPPSTPSRPSPNIARRRGQAPFLVRTIASPGHSVKMSQIFQDAQASLQSGSLTSSTPSGRLSSNTKRTRIPRLQLQQGTPHDYELPLIMASAQSPRRYTPSGEAPTFRMPRLYAETPPELPCSPLYPTPQAVFSSEMDTASLNMSEPISSGFVTPVQAESRQQVLTGPSISRHAGHSIGLLSAMATFKENIRPYEDGMEGVLRSSPSICLPMHGPNRKQRSLHPAHRDEVHGVDAWLKDIPDISPGNTPSIKRVRKLESQKQTSRTPPWNEQTIGTANMTVPSDGSISPSKIPQRPRSDSNKENQSPPKASPVRGTGLPMNVVYRHAEQPAYLPQTPHRPIMNPSESSKTPSSYRFTDYRDESKESTMIEQATTPRGLFMQSARRKRQKASANLRLSQLPTTAETSFVIAEDDEPAVALSPDVEPYRKDNRPRRNRCASYFDEDIIVSPIAKVKKTIEGRVEDFNINVDAHKGQKVLAESLCNDELTRPKAFMEGIEECGSFGEQEGLK
ncbi:MAG: hypothetical protein M1812_005540 [Candelaria pacifica]|nr:MAG: hypothetical protein M1812_005540 [Candelaria pacifica]